MTNSEKIEKLQVLSHLDFRRTKTGRMVSTAPNFQTLPHLTTSERIGIREAFIKQMKRSYSHDQ